MSFASLKKQLVLNVSSNGSGTSSSTTTAASTIPRRQHDDEKEAPKQEQQQEETSKEAVSDVHYRHVFTMDGRLSKVLEYLQGGKHVVIAPQAMIDTVDNIRQEQKELMDHVQALTVAFNKQCEALVKASASGCFKAEIPRDKVAGPYDDDDDDDGKREEKQQQQEKEKGQDHAQEEQQQQAASSFKWLFDVVLVVGSDSLQTTKAGGQCRAIFGGVVQETTKEALASTAIAMLETQAKHLEHPTGRALVVEANLHVHKKLLDVLSYGPVKERLGQTDASLPTNKPWDTLMLCCTQHEARPNEDVSYDQAFYEVVTGIKRASEAVALKSRTTNGTPTYCCVEEASPAAKTAPCYVASKAVFERMLKKSAETPLNMLSNVSPLVLVPNVFAIANTPKKRRIALMWQKADYEPLVT